MGKSPMRTSFMERRKQMMAQKMADGSATPSSVMGQITPNSNSCREVGDATNSNKQNLDRFTFDKSSQNFTNNTLNFRLVPTSRDSDRSVNGNVNDNGGVTPNRMKALMPIITKKNEESDEMSMKMQSNYKFFLSLQPSTFEENGVNVVEKIMKQHDDYNSTGCKIHFVNMSSNAGLARVREIKKNLNFSSKVSYEMTPHHLIFSAQDIADKETNMKCNPPIRDTREQSLLLIQYKKGYFDAVSSAHFPVDPIYKKAGGGNFFKAFNGVSTLGFTLQVLWTLFHTKLEFSNSNNNLADQNSYLKLLSQVLAL